MKLSKRKSSIEELICCFIGLLVLLCTGAQSSEKRVVCYYANWAVYRQGTAKFTPQNINPYLCTHVIYAFVGLTKNNELKPFDDYNDIEKGGYRKFIALKNYNRNLKTMIAIGGWNEGSKRFSRLVEDPEKRATFIASAINFLRKHHFDGLDLDWEYPAARDGGRPQDKKNYARFVAELRIAFEEESAETGKERLLLTMAVPASLEYASKGFDVPLLNEVLDWFNFLTYDYHSSYEASTNHHSPLYKPQNGLDFLFDENLSVDATVKHYLRLGATSDKIVLGIPTYGRSYTLGDETQFEIGAPSTGPGKKGKGTKEDGYLAYFEICQAVQDDLLTVSSQYPGELGPFAYNDTFWVGYDDVEAVMDKAEYVVDQNLGGIMFWTIDNDDFRGACDDKPFALIESAKRALYGKRDPNTKTSVSVSKSSSIGRTRGRDRNNQKPRPTSRPDSSIDPFNTPKPPTTPRNEPDFQCETEGFFAHGSSCKKYYWCTEAPTGIVSHTFTCPNGLVFNDLTGGCDFRTNVDCNNKLDDEEPEEKTTKAEPEVTTKRTTGKSLEEILEEIKKAGGVDAYEEKIEQEKAEKERKENERSDRIRENTSGKLSKLFNRANRKPPTKAVERTTKPPKVTTRRTTTEAPSERPRSQNSNFDATKIINLLRNRSKNRPSNVEEESDSSDRKPQTSQRGSQFDATRISSLLRDKLKDESSDEEKDQPERRPQIKVRKSYASINRPTRPTRPPTRPTERPTAAPKIEEPRESPKTAKLNVEKLYESINRPTRPPTRPPTRAPERPATSPKSTKLNIEKLYENINRPTSAPATRPPPPTRPTEPPTRPPTRAPFRPAQRVQYSTINRGSSRFRNNKKAEKPVEIDEDTYRKNIANSRKNTAQQKRPLYATIDRETNRPAPKPKSEEFNFVTAEKTTERVQLELTTEKKDIKIEIPITTSRPPFSFTVTTERAPEIVVESRNNYTISIPETELNSQNLPQILLERIKNISTPKVKVPERPSSRFNEDTRPRPSGVKSPEKAVVSRPLVRPRPINRQPVDRPRSFVRPQEGPKPEVVQKAEPEKSQFFVSSQEIREPIVVPSRDPSTAPSREQQSPRNQLKRPNVRIPESIKQQTRPTAQKPARSQQRRPVAKSPENPTVFENDEYEYYYEYYYDESDEERPKAILGDGTTPDILPSGKIQCHGVGIFSHAASCQKFIICHERTERVGITGWEYECPSYLAFDPVEKKCNYPHKLKTKCDSALTF